MIDALSLIRARHDDYREEVRAVFFISMQDPPETVREWLLFEVNQRLRNEGIGKPLRWKRPQREPA
jgi:hypothetical protein